MKSIILLLIIFLCSLKLAAQNFFDISTVQDVRIIFPRNDWDFMLDSMAQAGDDYSLATSVSINGNIYYNVGIKYKGNSSYNPNNTKNSLAVKLDFIQNQDYQGYNSFKLNNAFKDPSFVREVMGYEIARKYMPAVGSNYANVYVNGNLHGLYSNVQDLNKGFLANNFAGNAGSFFKCDPVTGTPPSPGCNPGGSTLEYLGADTACFYNRYENQNIWGWAELQNLTNTLNNNTSQAATILDIDRALWMIAFDNVFCNLDSYLGSGHNYYIYRDENGQFSTLVWDLNEFFGVFLSGMNLAQMQTLSPLYNSTQPNRPLLFRLLSNPRYKKSYIAHLKTILEENVTNGFYLSRAQQLQNQIDSYVSSDPNKLFSYTQFQQNINQNIGSVWGLTTLMEPRDSFLSQHPELSFPAPVISNVQAPQNPLNVSSVFITAAVSNATNVRLRYRSELYQIFTDDQMFDDGNHGDGAAGDGVFGAAVLLNTPQKQYYIYAENANAAKFSPVRAEYEFYTLQTATTLNPGDIVINEFMASDSTAIADQNGEFDDWIELYNNTAQPISLNGFYLSDNFGNPQKWQFPDTTIAANGYLIVWADNDTFQSGLHAFFKLSASGEEIILSAANGSVLDSISYAQQTVDVSYSRIPNGTGNFEPTTQNTFSANNDNTALESNKEQNWSVMLYPNPTKGLLTLQIQSEVNKDFEITIIDLMGRALISKQLNNLNAVSEQFNLTEFPAGTYLICVKTDNKVRIEKLLRF